MVSPKLVYFAVVGASTLCLDHDHTYSCTNGLPQDYDHPILSSPDLPKTIYSANHCHDHNPCAIGVYSFSLVTMPSQQDLATGVVLIISRDIVVLICWPRKDCSLGERRVCWVLPMESNLVPPDWESTSIIPIARSIATYNVEHDWNYRWIMNMNNRASTIERQADLCIVNGEVWDAEAADPCISGMDWVYVMRIEVGCISM